MLDLAFISSSRIKRAHANHLCRNYDLTITRQKNYGVGYHEPRIRQREFLLEQSIQDALKRWKKHVSNPDKFFFIEDTSVIIHALSNEGEEVPGVDIKYWMRDHDFESVDALLKANGNNRAVTVRSDILLTLPPHLEETLQKKYERFTSESHGIICEQQFNFDTNSVYPWLDNKTFNKWFVPDGYDKPISMLEIEQADTCDFRAGAFEKMLTFLVKYENLKEKNLELDSGKQLGLKIDATLFLVSGPTCAGKTTLAEYLTSSYDYYHIEASDFMYLSYYQMHGIGSAVKIRDFAHDILLEDPSIVVRQILKHLEYIGNAPVIITGFRSPKEVEIFEELYPRSNNIEVIYVDASFQLRFDRYVKRARHGQRISKPEFMLENERQNEMGLNTIGERYCEDHLNNDLSFSDFHELFNSMYGQDIESLKANSKCDNLSAPSQLEDAILIAMMSSELRKYRSTTEISKLIEEVFKEFKIVKNKNNVSRYFNHSLKPYFEITIEDKTKKYRLSQTGIMHARWLMQHKKTHTKPQQKKQELGNTQQSLFY